MADEDLSKLRIDKAAGKFRPSRRKRALVWSAAILLLAAAAVLYGTGLLKPAVEVEVVSVAKIYPSQAFTVLNASGYVVAQRKAAVASKITGRLVSLSVEEGSSVKGGEVIARLENDDVSAARDQAAANLNVARS